MRWEAALLLCHLLALFYQYLIRLPMRWKPSGNPWRYAVWSSMLDTEGLRSSNGPLRRWCGESGSCLSRPILSEHRAYGWTRGLQTGSYGLMGHLDYCDAHASRQRSAN